VASDPKLSSAGTGNGGSRKNNPAQPWQVLDSEELYHVNAWGKGYFSINAAGHVVVRPDTQPDREIDLYEVVEGLKARDLTTPVVVRFSDILAHRLKNIHLAFAQAIAENDYKNRYAAVFPIKVNQQRLVVEEVYRYGKEFGFGLEAGSKPELLAVMAMTESTADRLIICNGFKDDSYIEAVTLATKLGRTIIPVVENFDELGLILAHSQTYGVRPRIGVRVKLFSEGSGRWRDSAGEKSKFGLFVTEIMELFNILKSHDMLDCLQLVDCHPGSQLQDIRRVKDAINELAHVYAELKLMGAGLQYIDVGGGSTELTFFSDGKLIFKESFNIGTIRLLKNQVTELLWDEMKEFIKLKTKGYHHVTAIGSGGNINKIFSLSKRKEGKPLPLDLLRDYFKEFSNLSVPQRISLYKLREDRADVIVPALLIYINVMRWADAQEIFVPKIGLADGLIYTLYEEVKKEYAPV